MFEFIFELIDLFFTFYPKSIDINIVFWNIFDKIFFLTSSTCKRMHNPCSLGSFSVASLPWSSLYLTPSTKMSFNFWFLIFHLTSYDLNIRFSTPQITQCSFFWVPSYMWNLDKHMRYWEWVSSENFCISNMFDLKWLAIAMQRL